MEAGREGWQVIGFRLAVVVTGLTVLALVACMHGAQYMVELPLGPM